MRERDPRADRYEYVWPNGAVVDLSTGPIRVLEADGLGAPDPEIETSRAPGQHGSTVRRVALGERSIGLTLLGEGLEQRELRARMLRTFNPLAGRGRLRVTRPDGTSVECREVLYREGLGMEGGWPAAVRHVKAVARLVAHDPFIYETDLQHLRFELGVGGDVMAVPLAVPWKVGASLLDGAHDVVYGGTVSADPVITIRGPVTELELTNASLGARIAWRPGVAIGAGETRTVDTRPGLLVVRDAAGALRTGELTDDSDLAGFRLAADPEAPDGVNNIRINGLGASQDTSVTFMWEPRLLGI